MKLHNRKRGNAPFSDWLGFVCFRCRVPGTYYFVYHASLEDRLCVLMKLDGGLLASFCDHRRTRRQVSYFDIGIQSGSSSQKGVRDSD